MGAFSLDDEPDKLNYTSMILSMTNVLYTCIQFPEELVRTSLFNRRGRRPHWARAAPRYCSLRMCCPKQIRSRRARLRRHRTLPVPSFPGVSPGDIGLFLSLPLSSSPFPTAPGLLFGLPRRATQTKPRLSSFSTCPWAVAFLLCLALNIHPSAQRSVTLRNIAVAICPLVLR